MHFSFALLLLSLMKCVLAGLLEALELGFPVLLTEQLQLADS